MISDKPKTSIKIRIALNFLFPAALAIIFLFIAFYDVNFIEVLDIVSGASVFWLLIFVVLQFLSHILRAVRWKVILSTVKPDTKLKHIFGSLMVGYGVNCVIPRLGEVTRAVLMGKWEGLSRSSMFGSVILERIIDMIFLGITVIISMMIWSESISESFPWLRDSLYITLFLIIALIFFVLFSIRYRERFGKFLTKLTGYFSEKLSKKTTHIFGMFIEGFSSLKGARNYSLTIILSCAIILLYAISSYVGFFTVGMQYEKPVTFAMGWVLMSISAIGVVIPTPGGTGSYHTLAKSTLVLLFGFGETISVAYAFLTHIVSYFLFIFTALIIFFILDKQHGNILKIVETDLEES